MVLEVLYVTIETLVLHQLHDLTVAVAVEAVVFNIAVPIPKA